MVAAVDARRDPTFGVVVINWNNPDDTLACLDALFRASPPPDDVVVVDNGSQDDSLKRIHAWVAAHGRENDGRATPVHVIPAGRNLGFAGGTNVGIHWLMSETKVSNILLLNNDATVSASFFDDAAESIALIGGDSIVGPTIFEDPDRDKVWYAGGIDIPIRGLLQHKHVKPLSEVPQVTDFVTGCAMIISRGVIEKVGALSECFFPAYFEDGDFCLRGRKAGFRVMYAPKPTVYHKVGATVRAANLDDTLVYHKNRLRVIYVRRNYTGAKKVAALGYLALTKPARFAVEVLRGHPRHGWAVLSGASAGFLARGIRTDL